MSVIGQTVQGGGRVVGFGAAPGAPFGDEKAAEIGQALEALARPDGEIMTEDILSAAQNPESPLHSLMEWNNDTAAHNYRMGQAREVISHLQLIVRRPDGGTTRQKFALSLQVLMPERSGEIVEKQPVQMHVRAYVPTPQVVSVPAQTRQAEAQAMHELRCWYRRYAPLELPGLAMATDAIGEILGK